MFYKTGVDISNTKSMWEFLAKHYTYNTMNSWNGLKSVANNVKLHKLNLDGDWTNVLQYLVDAGDCGNLQLAIDDEIMAFNEEYYPNYRVGFNGRSNGYLVLYNSENNRSVLPECVAYYESYEDFKEETKSCNENVSDYNYELRQAVKLVRDFDKLCDRLRDIVNEYSTRNFEEDKLNDAIERFYSEYGDDLDDLNIQGPRLDGDKIRLYDIGCFHAFMDCLISCFGDDSRRVDFDSKYVWLKES